MIQIHLVSYFSTTRKQRFMRQECFHLPSPKLISSMIFALGTFHLTSLKSSLSTSNMQFIIQNLQMSKDPQTRFNIIFITKNYQLLRHKQSLRELWSSAVKCYSIKVEEQESESKRSRN